MLKENWSPLSRDESNLDLDWKLCEHESDTAIVLANLHISFVLFRFTHQQVCRHSGRTPCPPSRVCPPPCPPPSQVGVGWFFVLMSKKQNTLISFMMPPSLVGVMSTALGPGTSSVPTVILPKPRSAMQGDHILQGGRKGKPEPDIPLPFIRWCVDCVEFYWILGSLGPAWNM